MPKGPIHSKLKSNIITKKSKIPLQNIFLDDNVNSFFIYISLSTRSHAHVHEIFELYLFV